MPEGDTVAGHAQKLRPLLVGKEIQTASGTAASLRSNAARIRGSIVTAIRTSGKHLVVDFDSGYSLRVHLGMSGTWRVVPRHGRVPGSARVVLSTDEHDVFCMAAPTVEVDRTGMVDRALARLGPDLLSTDVDIAEIVRRARVRGSSTLAEVLLDQTVAAGIGNVYKSELAFLAGIHPDTPVGSLSDGQLAELYEEARQLLGLNVGPRPRTTTGVRRRDEDTWVYGRSGARCRRCSARIVASRSGDRITYWCSGCQTLPTSG